MGITIALTIFVITAILLVVVVLLQQSKGAGIGPSFGSGAAGTVFGSKGASSFLYKLTCVLALIFFVSSIVILRFQNNGIKGENAYPDAEQIQQIDNGPPTSLSPNATLPGETGDEMPSIPSIPNVAPTEQSTAGDDLPSPK